MPHSKSSCQKTTYRRYRKGAFFFLFPGSYTNAKESGWAEQYVDSLTWEEHALDAP